MSKYQEVLDKLKEPFPEGDILWRVQSFGGTPQKPWVRVLAYLDSRAVQNRLDEIVGPENWRVSYTPVRFGREEGFICTLAIRLGEEWLEKSDGANLSETEPFKGGISDSFKRSAVMWGIGRYLYDLPSTYADIVSKNECRIPTKYSFKFDKNDREYIYWNPRPLPAEFLPRANGKTNGNGQGNGSKPEPFDREHAISKLDQWLTYLVGDPREVQAFVKTKYQLEYSKINGWTDSEIKAFGAQVQAIYLDAKREEQEKATTA